jgi:hydrogenase maturation protease
LSNRKIRILIYGYGNPGRQDDGLGVILSEEIEKWAFAEGIPNIQTDSNYQLNLEDAAGIAEYDLVVFADASGENISNFLLEELKPSPAVEFTMHAVSPAFILHLCHQVFEKNPRAYLLHIRGYEWEFMSGMTDRARSNLEMATIYLKDFLLEKLK